MRIIFAFTLLILASALNFDPKALANTSLSINDIINSVVANFSYASLPYMSVADG